MTDLRTAALRLAGELECGFPVTGSAAAELRRLHAENERLHQINRSHEMKLSVRGYEIQIADLVAQRDALLEALKAAEPYLRHADVAYNVYVQARAAIKAAEENT